MTIEKRKEIIRYSAIFILSLVSLMVFHLCYKYHFFVQEQNHIFIWSQQYISEYFTQNSWLTCLLGDFLTQFFYYLYVGPTVSAVVILLIAVENYRIFSKIFGKNISIVLSNLIEFLLLFTVFDYLFKIECLLSVFFGFLFYDIYSVIFKKEGLVSAIVCLVVVYVLAGFAQIIFAAIYAAKLLKQKRIKEFWVLPAIAFVVPMFGHRICQTTYAKNLSYPGIYTPALPDSYAEFSCAIATEYYFKHYDRVERLAMTQDTMSAQSGIYYNMIQAQKGILPDKIKEQAIPELGTLIHIGEGSPYESIALMNDFYYLIGDMAMAERAAIMAQVFSPENRNVKMIKRLCEINLVTGDTAVAMKYVRILENTLLYKDWASKHNPYSLDPKVEKEILEKRKYCNTTKAIRITDNCREILIQLLESNPDNIPALDYLLCTDLILGQRQTFKADYYRFCVGNNKQRLKKLYIEALSK
ncbi:MAG: DUF6057 family protein [Bacteroidales bacterium]|nr:DUF6057 family protein [Bacteroidales bacterium]